MFFDALLLRRVPPHRRPAPESSPRGPRTVPAGCLVCFVAVLCGCEQRDDLRQYTVAKPPLPIKAPLPQKEAPATPPPAVRSDRPTDRTLGAMVPQGEQTWFIKLSGPIEATRSQIESFLSFVKSLRFADGRPNWDLPPGWTAAPNPEGKGRFATLAIDAGAGKLEATVTSLPTPPKDLESYLLMNVNRWRTQLGQREFTAEEFGERTVQLKLQDDVPAWLVNLEGWGLSAGAPGGAAAMAAGPTRPAPAAPRLPFAYRVPEGWVPGELNAFRLAAWKVQEGDQTVTVTVSTAGGDLVQNINRWREQVGLERGSEDQVRSSIQQVPLGTATGSYVKLIPSPETEKSQTILGVIAPAGEQTWFFKLQGDSALALREQQKFEEFLKSIEFK